MQDEPMEVRTAETPADLDEARRLIRAFLAWHREQHVEDLELIDAYFDPMAFEAELAGLPGEYGPPDGAPLLAWEDGVALGCVASHRHDETSSEMKRMFVPIAARGTGAGRALAEAIVAWARDAGYREMLLETSVRQLPAMSLYRSLGFVETEPYYDFPPEMRDWLVFFRLEL